MAAYYNEFDQFAAAWLRELIKEGLIADGVVDERSITEVKADEIKEFTQCHFFAGIGGWSYALRLAGWSDDRPVWTGSPPCQPFSVAGKRKGTADERHLWPAFFNLIRECNPPTIFGEQVAAAIRDNWFDALQADMEGEGYATGMVVLPACSVGAPHKRDRLWFVGHSNNTRSQGRHSAELCECSGEQFVGANVPSDSTLANSATQRPHYKEDQQELEGQGGGKFLFEQPRNSTMGDTKHNGSHGAAITGSVAETSDNSAQGRNISGEPTRAGRPDQSGDIRHWSDTQLIYCRDGKHRPIPTEPTLFPLANGLPNRVGILRGAGNAIVPQVAAEVIKAFMRV